MSTHTLNEAALRALKRPDIQKLAKREGLRAIGKKDDMIAALVAKYPGGIQPLEKEQTRERRSKRHGATQVREEEKEDKIEPAVYGDNISQYIPARPKNKKADAKDGVAVPPPRIATPPLLPSSLPPPQKQDVPAPRPTTKAPSPRANPKGELASRHLQAAQLEPAPEFVQGSSRPVEQPGPAPLREREHLTTGVSVRAAVQTVIPGVQEGVSRTTQEFLELLDEQDIHLLPPGQAALNQWPPFTETQADDTEVAQSDSEVAPPIAPRPPHIAISPSLTPATFHLHPAPAGSHPRPHPDSQSRNPRPPVFTRPPPQPVQPEASPSRLPAEAGPSRRMPTPPWLMGRVGPSSIMFPWLSPPARPRAPSPHPQFPPRPRPQAQPKSGPSGIPQLQTQAGPSRAVQGQPGASLSMRRLDPNDNRFKVPALPERLSQSEDTSFTTLSEGEIAARQLRSGPSNAEIRAAAILAARRPEATGQAATEPTPAPKPEAVRLAEVAEFNDEWETEESLLNPTYDLIPSPPDCSDDEDGIERRYFTMLKRFVNSDTSDSDSEPEIDSEDQRLAALEVQAKARTQRASGHVIPDGPQRTMGATGSQVRKMVFDARRMAEKMQGARVKRKEMARKYDFLEAQQKMLEILRLELNAKRLALEETVITKLKKVEEGWLDGSWAPPEKEFKIMKSRAFTEQYQYRTNTMQEDDVDWEDPQEIVVMEGQDEFDRFFEDDEPEGYENEMPALGPAFEYHPVNARRGSDSSSSLPPSSPPYPDPLLAAAQNCQPDPVTPPRYTQIHPPAPTQEGSDSFKESSSESSGNAARPKFLHPTGAIDKAVHIAQVGPPEVPQAGLYADPPPMYGTAKPWPYRHTYEEIGSSISHLGKKRRRDEEDDDEVGPSACTTTEEKWVPENEEHSSMSQPAEPQSVQAGYVPRPVVGYTGVAGKESDSPEPEPYYAFAEEYTRPPAQADWRDLRGGRLVLSSPSPPKRARRGYH